MSYAFRPIRTLSDLGARVAEARKTGGHTATSTARQANRSRDILHRLERGEDVSVSSLLDILRAIGIQLELTPARAPTLDEVKERFAENGEDGRA
jgi:transcriptional regulator with XRE-family HTH domain